MSRVLDWINLARAYRSVYCHIYNQAPETTATLAYAGQFLTPEERHNFSRAFCGDEPNAPMPPFPAPPFQGGQCDGVPYIVSSSANAASLSDCSPATLLAGEATVFGPITSIKPFNVQECVSPQGASGKQIAQAWEITCRGLYVFPFQPGPPGTKVLTLTASSPNKLVDTFNVSVSRLNGQPDTCGNPPPEYPGGDAPALPWPGDLNPPGEEPGWSPWPLNPSFEVGPDGIRICFDTPVGRACFSYDGLDLQPGTPGGDDPSPSPLPGPDGAGPDASDPAPPYPPDLPPEDDPTDEETRIIRGVIVTAEGQGSTTVVFQEGGNPDVLVPDCGLVNFKIRMADGTIAWSEDQRVKNGRNLIVCPWPYGAINVKGTPRGGYNMTLTPIYDELVFQPATP